MSSRHNVTSALAHVLWIGGAPDAGKSSIAQLLAEKYQLQMYSCDQWEAAHFARLVPEHHSAMLAVSPSTMTTEQRWVLRPPKVMAQQTIAAWSERFSMTLDDLLAMPRTSAIVAEGPGLFPECVAPLLSTPRQAIWTMCDGPINHVHLQLLPRYAGDPIGSTRFVAPRGPLVDGASIAQRLREALEQ